METNISISEYNGIAQIVALMTNSDIKVKSNAESTLYKIAKQGIDGAYHFAMRSAQTHYPHTDRNIGYAREAGALAALLTNINVGGQNTPVSATEYSVISNAALAISSMARNGRKSYAHALGC